MSRESNNLAGTHTLEIAKDNPLSNCLNQGVTEEQVVAAVTKSGYPLQTFVGDLLRSRRYVPEEPFYVQEEWSYIDPDDRKLRSLDLLAELRLHGWNPQPRVRPSLSLLIECKQSTLP